MRINHHHYRRDKLIAYHETPALPGRYPTSSLDMNYDLLITCHSPPLMPGVPVCVSHPCHYLMTPVSPRLSPCHPPSLRVSRNCPVSRGPQSPVNLPLINTDETGRWGWQHLWNNICDKNQLTIEWITKQRVTQQLSEPIQCFDLDKFVHSPAK